MKKSITISMDSEKLSAAEMYMEQKNMKLSEELKKAAEQLYQKNVPQNVKDFIEMRAAVKPERKLRRTAERVNEYRSENNSPCDEPQRHV